MALTLPDRDIGRIAAARRPDVLLDFLLDLAYGNVGVSVPVTLIVDGVLIRGRPVRDIIFASALDDIVRKALSTANVVPDPGAPEEAQQVTADAASEVRAAVLAALTEAGFGVLAQKEHDRRQEAVKLVFETAGDEADAQQSPNWDALPADLAREFVEVQMGPIAFSLQDVEVHLASGIQHLPFARVRVASVSAWWVTPPEPQSEGS